MGNPTDWRELSALRRLADDVHKILAQPTIRRGGVVWDRLTEAYDRYIDSREEPGSEVYERPAEPEGNGERGMRHGGVVDDAGHWRLEQ